MWELPFKRIGWPRMPTVKPCRQEVKPIFQRPKPRVFKVGDVWLCEHPDTVPPGYDWPNRFEGCSPRMAWLGWYVFCKSARCPGTGDLYHMWTYGYQW